MKKLKRKSLSLNASIYLTLFQSVNQILLWDLQAPCKYFNRVPHSADIKSNKVRRKYFTVGLLYSDCAIWSPTILFWALGDYQVPKVFIYKQLSNEE